MTTTSVGTSLMLSVSQIIEGKSTCAYCDDEALFTVSTGADPKPEPHCYTHGKGMIDAHARLVSALFGPKTHRT